VDDEIGGVTPGEESPGEIDGGGGVSPDEIPSEA
jgi:hypothetical protein